TRLLDIAQAIKLPEGEGYLYIAGEATAASEVRKHFRDVVGVDKERITSVGYWVEGQSRG
ncbi:MAG: SIP domain-containing protein, partial [Rhizobium pusense]|nr:SIP domain-containing protein [Agrobacterium pusense]